MACDIRITSVEGTADDAGNLIAVRVEGTAPKPCEHVVVEGQCAKPFVSGADVLFSPNSDVGTWEATLIPPPGSEAVCICGDRHVYVARCSAPASAAAACVRAVWVGLLRCGRPKCPEVVIHVWQGGNDVTSAVLNSDCVQAGDYRFTIERTVPGSPIFLKLEVNGLEIDVQADTRVSALAPDYSSFNFTLASNEILEVNATTFAPECDPDSDAVILKGCEKTCDDIERYNPITNECCPPGEVFHPETGECIPEQVDCPPERLRSDGSCCPPGTVVSRDECCAEGSTFNPETRRCENNCPPGQERNPLTGECCPPRTRYNPRTGRCEPIIDCPRERLMPDGRCCPEGTTYDAQSDACRSTDNGREGGAMCDCGPWWCYLLGLLLAVAAGLIILAAADCFTFDSETLVAALQALAAGTGFDATLILAVLEAIGVGAIATAVWRTCGTCCVACALWIGLLLGVVLIIVQWVDSGMPPCLWPAGVLSAVAVAIMAWMFTDACTSGE